MLLSSFVNLSEVLPGLWAVPGPIHKLGTIATKDPSVNPRLSRLQPYPFEKLRALLAGVAPPALAPIRLSIGEPQHATPDLIRAALVEHLDGLSVYPTTAGLDALREALAAWFRRRYAAARARCRDPGAAGQRHARSAVRVRAGGRRRLASGAARGLSESRSIRSTKARRCSPAPSRCSSIRPRTRGFALDLESLTEDEWRRTQLMYVCSPGNPTGRVLTLDEWRALFEHADRYGFVIASDECYSEIYRRRGRRRRSAGSRPRTGSAATTSAIWSSSRACRSARTRRDCARAPWPAMPRCCGSSCSIARIMDAR